MTSKMCELATKLPQLVATLLDRESKLRRGRFREETLTDLFTGALAIFAGPELVIEYPPEASTGGDLDLEFWHVSSGQQLLLRIQAKRLNAGINNGKPVSIQNRSYNELLHRVPKKTGPYQFDTLVKKCGPFLPLYMFYNHGSVVQDSLFSDTKPVVSGINLAFAFDIADEMDAKLTAKGKKLNYKRLSYLRKHFFGLETILCPIGNDNGVPSPDFVSRSLYRTWNASPNPSKRVDDERVIRLFAERTVIDAHIHRRLQDGPAIRVNRNLERPTITFITGRTEDRWTPRIDDQG